MKQGDRKFRPFVNKTFILKSHPEAAAALVASLTAVDRPKSQGPSKDFTAAAPSPPVRLETDNFTAQRTSLWRIERVFLRTAGFAVTLWSRRGSEGSSPRGGQASIGTAAKHGGLWARGRSRGESSLRVSGIRDAAPACFYFHVRVGAPFCFRAPWIIVVRSKSCRPTASNFNLSPRSGETRSRDRCWGTFQQCVCERNAWKRCWKCFPPSDSLS